MDIDTEQVLSLGKMESNMREPGLKEAGSIAFALNSLKKVWKRNAMQDNW
jgi:hypothetical protein